MMLSLKFSKIQLGNFVTAQSWYMFCSTKCSSNVRKRLACLLKTFSLFRKKALHWLKHHSTLWGVPLSEKICYCLAFTYNKCLKQPTAQENLMTACTTLCYFSVIAGIEFFEVNSPFLYMKVLLIRRMWQDYKKV